MEFEFNPFQQTIPVGTEPITSITIESNLDWLTIPDVVLGANAIINLNADTATPALKVFGTGAGIGTPSMISLLAAHIPNIEISQVNGLEGELAAQLASLEGSIETAIEVTNNGVGDYLVIPHFGTSANTLAQGNDTRFSASVTGLRLGAGAGSADTAAVALTDYWDDTEFTGAGTIGLVPDPVAETGKYLKDDGTWATPAGTGTVTSIGLVMPAAVFNISGSPVTTAGDITVTFDNQNANTFFMGPASGVPAAPAFRSLAAPDIAGLFGSSSDTIAEGDDTRFPASVTGLRKSSGAGSTDTAAVAGVDYAAATVFGGKGPSHSIGLVPDPGTGSSPYIKYLRDDGSWQVFTPDTASLTNAMLATMAAKTLKANATAGTASPTDVTAIVARSSSLLNLESVTTHGNSDYSIVATDRYVATSANLTVARTWTLPLANSFNAGQPITVSDDFGGINGAFTLKVAVQGGDVIQGATADLILDTKYASVTLSSDGSSKWSVVGMRPAIKKKFYIADATYTTPTGVKTLLAECIAAGAGGSGAVASGANAAAGSGGGGGGYAYTFISAPSASYAMIVGEGGAGGAGAADGVAGESTEFGAVCVATSGTGGQFMTGGTTGAFSTGGTGGFASAGDWGATGSDGSSGIRLSGTVSKSGGGGAAAIFGGANSGLASDNDGLVGSLYGGGGSGANSLSAVSRTGGDGQQGIIIVTEFY